MLCLNSLVIEVGARSSPLSKIQVQEVLTLLHSHGKQVQFNTFFFKTTGDLDHQTSLRDLDRTDFFTKEIDQWVLEKKGRVGIHSAKDLPYPLDPALKIFCVTKGIDSADVLVLRENCSLATLPTKAKIATSSERREAIIRSLRNDLSFCDIRGTIGQRLEHLYKGLVDGVVIAEAALIRLGFTHLNRLRLPGPTTEGQGKLAVVGSHHDKDLEKIFSSINNM